MLDLAVSGRKGGLRWHIALCCSMRGGLAKAQSEIRGRNEVAFSSPTSVAGFAQKCGRRSPLKVAGFQ